MAKIYPVSMNRASDGALSKLIKKMKENNIWTDDYKKADYLLVAGDRIETFDFALQRVREGKKIIHLWAGERCSDWTTLDESYRHTISMWSMMQLCTNQHAAKVVSKLFKAVKYPKELTNIHVIGNIMMDNMEVDDSCIPRKPYILILYNPSKTVQKDIDEILAFTKQHRYMNKLWLQPNGDTGSTIINKYVTDQTFPRPKFLGLLKHCRYFVTNSSCQYYEAPFFLKENQIIPIGTRNKGRESRLADMTIPGASDKVIELLNKLK